MKTLSLLALVGVLWPVAAGCNRRLDLDQITAVREELASEREAAREALAHEPVVRQPAAPVAVPANVVAPQAAVPPETAPAAAAPPVAVAEPNAIVTAASPAGDLDLRYDPSTEITIRDVVLGKHYVKLDDDHTGVVVRLQPGGNFIDVLVGTTQFLFKDDVDIEIAMPLMVTGSRIMVNGKPMLLAKTLFLRNREIRLRDDDNYPLWREHKETPPKSE
jgi:hypothetical protein